MTKEGFKRQKEYFEELIGDDSKRDVSVDAIELEVRIKWKKSRWEEDISKEEVRRAIMHLKNGRSG